MPKLFDIIEKLPKGWHKPQQSNKQKAKQRKPKKSNYQCVMEQIERIGTNGLFSILKGGYSSDRVHRWDSNSSANVIERKKKKKNNDDKPPKILYTPKDVKGLVHDI